MAPTTKFPSNRCRREWSNLGTAAAVTMLGVLLLPVVLGVDLLGGGIFASTWNEVTSAAAASFDEVLRTCYHWPLH